MDEKDKNNNSIEKILFENIPKAGISSVFRRKKLPSLVRYFVKGKTVEQASDDLDIYLPYARALYVNLEKLRRRLERD